MASHSRAQAIAGADQMPDRSEIARLDSWSLVAAVNNDRVFEGTLLASPAIDDRCQVVAMRGAGSAAEAYNAGLRQARNDVVVFAHQDVYLPPDWICNLERALARLAVDDPNWGVLGLFGIRGNGQPDGHVYSTGLKCIVGEPFDGPFETVSIDELLLIVRRSSGLSFDDKLPGFHLYGTDICLEAKKRGLKSYVIPAFCIHNSNGLRYLPASFWRAYFYLRKKWWSDLPIRTCCTEITKGCWPIVGSLRTALNRFLFRSTVGVRCADPGLLYQTLTLSSANSKSQRGL